MDCVDARSLLSDRRRGRLAPDVRAEVDTHLASCDECQREDAVDAALSNLLVERLPPRRAPETLRHSIEARYGLPAPARPARRAALPRVAFAAVAAMALVALGLFVLRPRAADSPMVLEAVNDHLRVLYSEHPLEVESGGPHQVKPWFEGRVDFAPVVRFGGDDDFPLQGGSIAYFVDRKAATYLYKRRLHLITLFVFRADGLPWPVPTMALGAARATESTTRGFHSLLWREGDLGYALVSDVDPAELRTLGARIASN